MELQVEVLQTIVALLMIIPSNIGQLIDFFSFAAWLFYGLTFLSLIVMRKTKSSEPRAYKVLVFDNIHYNYGFFKHLKCGSTLCFRFHCLFPFSV